MLIRIALSGAVLLALAVGVVAVGGATAAVKGGKLETTIALTDAPFEASSLGGSMAVDFVVTRSVPYDKDTIWVTNQCWDSNGEVVVDRDAAVMWGTSTSLVGTTGDMPVDGVSCIAYTTLRPWQDRPLDAPISYHLGE